MLMPIFHPLARLLAALVLLFCLAAPAQAADLAPHLQKKTLDNGVTVIVKETPGSKVATVQIWVKAGSVYEEAKEAGITHLIEHMIFKGTKNRGPGEIARAIEEKGGQINAYTSFEYTVYHATLSARHWSTAIEVLSDAVLHSIFDPLELEREKKVVLEELRMRNDRPMTKLFQELMRTAYTVHPYRLPVIGTAESVSAFNRDHILSYLKKHYYSCNFTIMVVGDLHAAQVFAEAKKLFGDLPREENRDPQLAPEPVATAPRLFALSGDINQTHLALAFPIPPFRHPDTPALDVLAGILGRDDTSRLYNQLRNEKGLVYQIDAHTFSPKDSGQLEITATLASENIVPAVKVALEELFTLKYHLVGDEELARVKRNLESEFVFNLERVDGQARVLGSFEFLTGDPREEDYLAGVRAVSREDIMRVANQYLGLTALTAGSMTPAATPSKLTREQLLKLVVEADNSAKQALPPSLVANSYLSNLHSFTLANGIKLLVRENHEVPTTAIRVVFPGGLMSETPASNGAFAFISELLPTATEKHSARQLSLAVSELAGELGGFTGKNTYGLKASFLSRFFAPGLQLVREVVRTPAFDAEQAEKIRPELLSQLKQQEDSLPALALREANRLLFQGHPYALNPIGAEDPIRNFTVADLRRLHGQQAQPEKMVIAVAGDVEAVQVYEEVNKLFGDWHPGEIVAGGAVRPPMRETVLPKPLAEPEFFKIERDKEQLHLVLNFLGTTLSSEDRFPLEVLETVLGGQSGRLFTQLRDKESLAYSLSSIAMLGLDTGSFGIYLGTSPEKKEAALAAMWRELREVLENPVSEAELVKAKNILISQYEINLQTHGSQAMEIALSESYKLGQDFGKRYVHEIERVSAESVLAVARKYIQPNRYVLVSVGKIP